MQVNSQLQTSNPDVYAVGDIAAFPMTMYGGKVSRQEHVVNARLVSTLITCPSNMLFLSVHLSVQSFDACIHRRELGALVWRQIACMLLLFVFSMSAWFCCCL